MKLLPKLLIRLGLGAIAAGLVIVCLTFFPIVKEEIVYTVSSKTNTNLTPVDTSFGIVIPKIGANAHVIENVNPYNAREYQEALTRGVAHAQGTSLPGQNGTMFLFSHSSVDFYRASQYNSVFYLIGKLETNDEIDIYYQTQKYVYRVTGKKIVEPTDISYLSKSSETKTLVLMTCYPPGTALKRLIVTSSAIE